MGLEIGRHVDEQPDEVVDQRRQTGVGQVQGPEPAVEPWAFELAVHGPGTGRTASRVSTAAPSPVPTSAWATSYASVSNITLGLELDRCRRAVELRSRALATHDRHPRLAAQLGQAYASRGVALGKAVLGREADEQGVDQ